MHSSRMRTARSLAVSRRILCNPQQPSVADPGFSPGGCANSQNCYYFSNFCQKLHENERIWTPGGVHVLGAPLRSANDHACPLQPHMPRATTHVPQQPFTPPTTLHASQATTHPTPQLCMPPSNHTCPPSTMHAPNHACPPHRMLPATMHVPPATTHAPPRNHACPPAMTHSPPPRTEFLTHASENITLPQTSFASGKNTSGGLWGCDGIQNTDT